MVLFPVFLYPDSMTRRQTLEEFRAFLGPTIASRYTEAELEQLKREMADMADIFLDLWIVKTGRNLPLSQPRDEWGRFGEKDCNGQSNPSY